MTETTIQPQSLIMRLIAIMGVVQRLPKSKRNAAQSYNYTPDSDVYDVIREQLVEQRLMIIPAMKGYTQTPFETSKGGKMVHTVCDFEFRIICPETGELETVTWTGEAMDSGDKSMSKAIAQATKTLLLKMFLISTGDDPDGFSPETEKGTKRPQPQPRQPAPPPPQKPATPKAPPVPAAPQKPTAAPAPTAEVDWNRVWSQFAVMGWRASSDEDKAAVFPSGTSGFTTDELIAMIKPKAKKAS